MHNGDHLIYYSPKVEYGGTEPLQAFTALGEVVGDKIRQVEMSPDFKPFRRKVRYDHTGTVKIAPLINDLSFIRNKRSWGSAFRFGMLEIPEPDFMRIKKEFEKGS